MPEEGQKAVLPRHATLELTYNCNHACPFCYCEWLSHAELYDKELSIEEWCGLVRTFAENGVKEFTFSGGEPLLKKGVFDLIAYAASLPQKPRLSLFSNGTLVDDPVLDFLQKHRVNFFTSIHSVHRMDFFSGARARFNRILDLVAAAKKRGIFCGVSMTVTQKNFSSVRNVGMAALLAGADSFQCGSVMAAGRNLQHPELMLTEKQMAKLQSIAGGLRKITGKTVAAVVEERCDCYREDAEGNIGFTWKDSCGAARSFFAVGPSGMLRPCLHIPCNICHWKDFRNFKQCRPV